MDSKPVRLTIIEENKLDGNKLVTETKLELSIDNPGNMRTFETVTIWQRGKKKFDCRFESERQT